MDKKYMIALDLDGTLLFDYSTIKEELIECIKKVTALGHKVVIATGRPYRSSIFVYNAFDIDTPLINYNGGLINHPRDKHFIPIECRMKKEDVLEICREHHLDLLNGFAEIYDDIHLMHEEEAIIPILHYNELATIHLGDLEETINEDVHGCLLLPVKEKAIAIRDEIRTKYPKIGARVWDWLGKYTSILELYSTVVNKGTGVKYVAEYLGFDRENIIAIGDSNNDIEMVKYAGIGVALKNASDDLKQIADIVYEKTNVEDGVIWFLTDFFKLD